MTVTDVATAAGLSAVRTRGAEVFYLCPNHDDHDPSLCVNPTKDCWMCGPCGAKGTPWQLAAFLAKVEPGDKAAVKTWLSAHGLSKSYGTAGRQIVAEYPYHSESGVHLYDVVRYKPKDFRPRQLDGTLSLPTDQRTLYRLPELIAAEYVFFCEGEKDVDNLRAIGLTATTSGAATSWLDRFAGYFRGKKVVILPDSDKPGRDLSQQVARSLSSVADSVKVLELPGLLADGGDVSDWLQGKDPIDAADELSNLADKAPEWTPSSGFAVPEHWKRLDVAKITEWECEPFEPIIDGILARGNLAFVAAQTQTGKTLLGLNLARKILQGGLLFGKYAITPVTRVEYFLLEDPDRRAKARILDTDHEFGPLEPGRFIINVAPGFKLTDDRMLEWFEWTLSARDGEDVVAILDTYQKATPGLNSFDDEKQGLILHKLSNLTRLLKVTLIVMDHFRKEGNAARGKRREVSLDDLKGTGGKAQNADCVILLERTPDKKRLRFQSLSKDFDNPVRILLDVAPRGSKEPKFKYAGDLEQLGARSHGKTETRRKKILESMTPGKWLSIAEIACLCKGDDKGMKTLQRDLTALVGKELDSAGETKQRRYCRTAESIGQNA